MVRFHGVEGGQVQVLLQVAQERAYIHAVAAQGVGRELTRLHALQPQVEGFL